MAEYHVGVGIAGIYAGILTKGGNMWKAKSDVTEEAIKAVFFHLQGEMDDDAEEYVVTYPSSEYELVMRRKEG